MKKLLLSLSIVLAFGSTQAQNLVTENFDVFPATWTQTNQSTPAGLSTWAQGGGTAFAPGGFNGGATSFALVNFNSTTGSGTISNWLITPVISLQNGDIISFYSRQGGTAPSFPDRLELRLSTNGAFTADPTGGASGLGDFTTLALSINPDLTLDGYPLTWTQFSYTVTGLSGPTDCKVGFRYWVTDGGPTGANSNIIGIDAYSVDRPVAATSEFLSSNFSIFPNPASNVVNINAKNGISLNAATITDLNGRTVKTLTLNAVSNVEMNIADLNSGVYFLNIASDKGNATTKIIKN